MILAFLNTKANVFKMCFFKGTHGAQWHFIVYIKVACVNFDFFFLIKDTKCIFCCSTRMNFKKSEIITCYLKYMDTNDSEVNDKVHIVWEKNGDNTVFSFWSVSTRLCPSAARFEVCIVLFPLLIGQLCLTVFLEDGILQVLYTNGQIMPLSLT